MNSELETNSLKKTFLFVFVTDLLLSLLVYGVFEFEIAVIFCISFSTALLAMGLVGIENVTILKK